jgi:hypothetical protein
MGFMNLTSFGSLCVISSLCLSQALDDFFDLTIAYILICLKIFFSADFALLGGVQGVCLPVSRGVYVSGHFNRIVKRGSTPPEHVPLLVLLKIKGAKHELINFAMK